MTAMRIRIINPNSTASMTAKVAIAAGRAAAPATHIETATSASGPVSIEGFFDGALSLPGLLAEIHAGERAGVDAHVIACFDDTGLDAARALARAPVIGIGEAGYHLATLVAGRFSVVTTLPRSIPVLEQNLLRYGLAFRCASVRAAGVAVLALEKGGSAARQRISAEVAAALSEDRAEAIVLGCAGMVELAEELAPSPTMGRWRRSMASVPVPRWRCAADRDPEHGFGRAPGSSGRCWPYRQHRRRRSPRSP